MRTPSEGEDSGSDLTVPAKRRRSLLSVRNLARVAGAGMAIAALSLVVQEGRPRATLPAVGAEGGPGMVPASAQVVRAARPLAETAPRFHLDDPEAIEPPRAEAARRNPASGRREDVVIQGGFDTIEAAYLRLTLTELSDPEPAPSLFITLARRAADGQALAVIRTGERSTIETKFGPMETLEVTLGGDGKRTCTGFVSLNPGTIRLDGWLCAPLGQAPEPRAITCLLDKVALNGQASPEMAAAFAAFEARRDPGCAPQAARAATREIGSETGSLASRATRKNEAKLRRSREARP
ncbi:hypothetical protein MKK58_22280 [Methylobacterium sp. J-078]|uniref:hypothetical protein n=1 Tax=Methylobacterium sp. J-078 TaxID=2836657 RepID=UPI001FB990B3|nr:hypothetical protein [Methylobacterium sp. J-078]MCJ2047242.1 hypothetical protein [Methylobacterium sp. J-078]